MDLRRVHRVSLQPSATRKPQGRAGVADAWVHGAPRGRPHEARRSVPRCAARRCPGRRRTDDARQRRSGTADEVAPRGICATWHAAALKGTTNLKRGVRSTVHPILAFSGGAQHRRAIARTNGRDSTGPAEPDRPEVPAPSFQISLEDRAGRSRVGASKRTPTIAEDAAELTQEITRRSGTRPTSNPLAQTRSGPRPKPIRPHGPSGRSSAEAQAHGRDERSHGNGAIGSLTPFANL
jgi:hypothetical protein